MGVSEGFQRRGAFVIQGWIGLLGHGKTMLAVQQSIDLARRRNAVLASNIRLSAPDVECVQLATGDDGLDLDQLRELVDRLRSDGRGLVLMLDEVGILMPARMWASFPVSLMMVLSQSRKLRLDLVYTSQDVEQVDAFLRRLTQWVWKVRAFPAPSLERQESGRRPLFYMVTQWRPASIEKDGKRIGRSFRRYRREWEAVYDTDEIVAPAARLARRGRSGRRAAVVAETVPAAPGGPNLDTWAASTERVVLVD